MKKITRKEFDKIIIKLLGRDNIAMSKITHVTTEAGKCAILDGQCYADTKALKLIGGAVKRKKRRSYKDEN